MSLLYMMWHCRQKMDRWMRLKQSQTYGKNRTTCRQGEYSLAAHTWTPAH
jgi:hypothetical protein